ncbi:MAG: GNAT family N-acetyltransferase [Tildeniella nuda ZEHNDER 1965/U140]|jgi:ribosomal protein S18 acetylase RimI-like enzyme|nr:GNAT family N-acetyltransferase [Tildeniella nuda ZEHNDER 1965/U140]
MGTIETRIATETDFDFLVDVHRQTFRGYVDHYWSWDEARQKEELREDFHAFPYEMICDQGEAAGIMCVIDQGEALFFHYIAILPTHQRQGLGTQLIRKVLAKAAERGLPVKLNVLKINPAKALYERLGFRVAGEDEYRYFMTTSEGTPKT